MFKSLIDCLKRVNKTLFVVGEIGGNDYTYALFRGKALEEVTALVRDVVQAINEAVRVSLFVSYFIAYKSSISRSILGFGCRELLVMVLEELLLLDTSQ